MMLQNMFFVLLTLFGSQIGLNLAKDHCCCCELSHFWEISRKWTPNNECESPKICCNIPSQYECELELNPTFDGSCGHINEAAYQKKHNGPKPVTIARNGESGYDMKGWFGERYMDETGNEIQEWCFDNGESGDSFFLYRFVPCSGEYPHWFGRCVFPSATNALMYSNCDSDSECDYSEFSSSIPSCFGEIEQINIGLGSDKGADVDYKYDVKESWTWIWCSHNHRPRNPPETQCLFNRTALSNGEGITPFYLTQCRRYNRRLEQHAHSRMEETEDDSEYYEKGMKPARFRVGIEVTNVESFVDWKGIPFVRYNFSIIGNEEMPSFYAASVTNGDNWSLAMKDDSGSMVEIRTPLYWSFVVSDVESGSYVTFFNNGGTDISLANKGSVEGFMVTFKDTSQKCDVAGWIARSRRSNSAFAGFGKLFLCQ